MSPVEIAGTPSSRERTSDWVPLPEPGGPTSTIFRAPAAAADAGVSAASPTDTAFLHEPLVVAHHELALDLLNRVHRDAHHDEERGAAEVEVDTHAGGEPVGEEALDPR